MPNITSSGWNSFDESISVKKGDSSFGSNKQLVVSMDSANDWSLILSPDKSDSIGYYIATSSTDTEAATMFTFSGASIDEGVSQNFGAIVSDYSTKPMGTYQDTITFTVEVQTTATDLSKLTGDYTAQDGETLTGTLSYNVKISIAAGATVILDSVDINGSGTWNSGNYAGINCEGNATIILSGTNIVKGFYEDYPGIFISPDSTLTISGDGKLTASGSGYGAGIGGGWDLTCGNIVIEGGTISAIGGAYAAGIGGGGTSTLCGNITITTGVTSVTATKGYYAPCSIGKGYGDGAWCGTVTIGGTVYWENGSYANGGADTIGQSSYTYTPSN